MAVSPPKKDRKKAGEKKNYSWVIMDVCDVILVWRFGVILTDRNFDGKSSVGPLLATHSTPHFTNNTVPGILVGDRDLQQTSGKSCGNFSNRIETKVQKYSSYQTIFRLFRLGATWTKINWVKTRFFLNCAHAPPSLLLPSCRMFLLPQNLKFPVASAN